LDQLEDATIVRLAVSGEVGGARRSLSEFLKKDAGADMQAVGVVGFQHCGLQRRQPAGLQEGIDPDGIEGRQIAGQPPYAGPAASKVAGGAQAKPEEHIGKRLGWRLDHFAGILSSEPLADRQRARARQRTIAKFAARRGGQLWQILPKRAR
jgi:hypothetical protein